jgi:hypothetical protein
MLRMGLSYRHDFTKNRVLKESSNHQYYFLYQRGSHNEELFAIYFSIVPTDRLWSMHQKLHHEIGQRNCIY